MLGFTERSVMCAGSRRGGFGAVPTLFGRCSAKQGWADTSRKTTSPGWEHPWGAPKRGNERTMLFLSLPASSVITGRRVARDGEDTDSSRGLEDEDRCRRARVDGVWHGCIAAADGASGVRFGLEPRRGETAAGAGGHGLGACRGAGRRRAECGAGRGGAVWRRWAGRGAGTRIGSDLLCDRGAGFRPRDGGPV